MLYEPQDMGEEEEKGEGNGEIQGFFFQEMAFRWRESEEQEHRENKQCGGIFCQHGDSDSDTP